MQKLGERLHGPLRYGQTVLLQIVVNFILHHVVRDGKNLRRQHFLEMLVRLFHALKVELFLNRRNDGVVFNVELDFRPVKQFCLLSFGLGLELVDRFGELFLISHCVWVSL